MTMLNEDSELVSARKRRRVSCDKRGLCWENSVSFDQQTSRTAHNKALKRYHSDQVFPRIALNHSVPFPDKTQPGGNCVSRKTGGETFLAITSSHLPQVETGSENGSALSEHYISDYVCEGSRDQDMYGVGTNKCCRYSVDLDKRRISGDQAQSLSHSLSFGSTSTIDGSSSTEGSWEPMGETYDTGNTPDVFDPVEPVMQSFDMISSLRSPMTVDEAPKHDSISQSPGSKPLRQQAQDAKECVQPGHTNTTYSEPGLTEPNVDKVNTVDTHEMQFLSDLRPPPELIFNEDGTCTLDISNIILPSFDSQPATEKSVAVSKTPVASQSKVQKVETLNNKPYEGDWATCEKVSPEQRNSYNYAAKSAPSPGFEHQWCKCPSVGYDSLIFSSQLFDDMTAHPLTLNSRYADYQKDMTHHSSVVCDRGMTTDGKLGHRDRTDEAVNSQNCRLATDDMSESGNIGQTEDTGRCKGVTQSICELSCNLGCVHSTYPCSHSPGASSLRALNASPFDKCHYNYDCVSSSSMATIGTNRKGMVDSGNCCQLIQGIGTTAHNVNANLSDTHHLLDSDNFKFVLEVDILQEARIQEFLKRVTAPDHSNNSPVSRNTANKFLMARKFDVNRAILLYDQHQAVRKQEDLIDVDITQTDVKQELLNEKFTILNARDPNGAAIALFTVRFHLPANTSHKATLKALIFQLDAALESSETQRNGLVFIYDMTQSKYINFDYELSIKILTLLKGAYPARLKKVLIVTAPLWFKAPFRILRLFVREKLRDRVYIVNGEQLRQHISSRALPRRLGGQMELNHRQWISKCLQLHWGKQIDNDLAAYFEDMDNTVMPELSIYSLSSSASSPPSSPGDSSPGTQPSSEHGSEGTVPEKHTSEYIEKHLQIGAEDGDILDQNMLMDIVDAERGGDVGLLSVARTSGQGQSQRSSRHSSSGASCDEVTSKSPQSYAQSSRNSTRASLTDSVVDSASQNQQCNRMTASDLGYSWTSEGGTSLCDVKTIPCKRGSDTSPSELGSDGQTVADYIPKRKAPSKFEDSIHKPESGGYSIKEFLDYTRAKGRPGLIQEYEKIKATRPLGTFDSSRLKVNADKNRYTDVPCFEHSRVKLEGKDDYINANFVDGYRHKGAYISTQGPLPRTFEDFWRMVWEHMILLVVMTTRTVERGRIKCGQYWPLEGEVEEFDSFVVTNQGERSHGDYTVTVLLLTNTATGEERQVTHMQFTSWPDYGVPACANAFLDFMHDVRKEQAMRTSQLGDRWEGHPGGPPIVVHCSAGIGRTGTFITMDILTRRLADIGTVDVLRTVERIRSQRAFSIQMPDQYVFIHHALLEHAQRDGLLDKSALSGFTDTGSDSELEDIFPNRTYIRPAPPKDSSIA